MLKKLLSKFRKKAEAKSPAEQLNEEYKKENIDVPPHPVEKEVPTIQIDLSTGKIEFPEGISDADKAEIEEAMAELQKHLPKDQFQSLEDFLSNSGLAMISPFTSANGLPDGLEQIKEELEFARETIEHWSENDLMEGLHSFYAQGYSFEGIEAMSSKVNNKIPLTEAEVQQLRDWYILASQDTVYDA